MLEKLSIYILAFLMVVIIYTTFFYDFTFSKRLEKADHTPDFVFQNVVVSHYNEGLLELQVSTNRAVIYRGSQEVIMEDAKGVSYTNNNGLICFNSLEGRFNLQSNNLVLKEAYMVFNQSDDYIWVYSKELFWDSLKKNIYSNADSTIHNKMFFVDTDYFLFDFMKQKISLRETPKIKIGVANVR